MEDPSGTLLPFRANHLPRPPPPEHRGQRGQQRRGGRGRSKGKKAGRPTSRRAPEMPTGLNRGHGGTPLPRTVLPTRVRERVLSPSVIDNFFRRTHCTVMTPQRESRTLPSPPLQPPTLPPPLSFLPKKKRGGTRGGRVCRRPGTRFYGRHPNSGGSEERLSATAVVVAPARQPPRD